MRRQAWILSRSFFFFYFGSCFAAADAERVNLPLYSSATLVMRARPMLDGFLRADSIRDIYRIYTASDAESVIDYLEDVIEHRFEREGGPLV